MSSTKDGNPPIAMNVSKVATNKSMEPLACKRTSKECQNLKVLRERYMCAVSGQIVKVM
jgi:ribosomal protein L15E